MNMFAKKKPSGKKTGAAGSDTKKMHVPEKDKKPKLADFLAQRDFLGAVTLLEFQKQAGEVTALTLGWLGYSSFHSGDYQKAADVYKDMIRRLEAQKDTADSSGSAKDKKKDKEEADDSNNKASSSSSHNTVDPVVYLYAACCEFYLGNYAEAESLAQRGPATKLQNRILFHVAHKLNDEKKLMKFHAKLTETVEDQLSLASMHYLRNHFQEATDIYKRLLIESREYLALQVYVALCYYKLDYYDVSLEILAPYLSAHPDSAIAINLKACNHYKLYDGKAAEQELKNMMDLLAQQAHNHESDLIRHNLVVFRNGENALQVLPPLIDTIPEARLNLVIYHLRHNEMVEAYELIKNIDPTTPQEYILKGVVNAAIGQMNDSREHMKLAQQLFQLVGASASECDTIPGRQCMASCFFLLKQFEDVLIYLNSVKAYSYSDSIFNYNYGLALAACGQFAEAQEALLLVTEENYKNEYIYLSWLAKCYIMNGRPRDAWELYLKMESNTDSFAMLVLIANDCYRVGSFFYSAKAFDVLERLDPSPEYWEGKRGACCGTFQQVIARREKKEHLREIVIMLRNNAQTPQAEFIIRVIKKWAAENGLNVGP